MREVEIICVRCPNGCEMTAKVEDGELLELEGNQCGEGVEHAREEMSNPQRILTTTVRVENGNPPLVSVRSSKPIEKGKLIPTMEEVSSLSTSAPVEAGEIIEINIDGDGTDIVATKSIELKGSNS